MKPKKKSSLPIIVGAISLVFAIFISLYFAIGYERALDLAGDEVVSQSDVLMKTVTFAVEQMEYHPSDIHTNEYSLMMLKYFGFAWLLIVLMMSTSKKNYIRGKEYGTARWGTIADIKDLFAANIAKEEIAKIKRMKFRLGRLLAKREALAQCEKEGKLLLKRRLEDAKKRELARKNNNADNRQLYREEIQKIKVNTRAEIEERKLAAWKPSVYKKECGEEIQEIRETCLLSEEEKVAKIKSIEHKYEKKKKEFYNTDYQVMKIKEKYAHADVLFTEKYKTSFYNYKLNQNVLILGGSGAGKTRGYVMPNVLQASAEQGHSYIISDPKGEILEKSGYYLEKICGYKIRVLNLDEKANSDGYNPFKYVHPERSGYEERVLSLIETIILNTDGGKQNDGTDPFWPKAEKLFLQAIFFFVVDGFVEEERNLGTAMKLIRMLDIGEEEDKFDSDLDYFAKIMEERFGSDNLGVEQYNEFRSKASGKTAKSVVISAVARLAPFKTKEVRRLFSYDNMDLDRIGEEKYAIFVVTPPTDRSFNFIAGMLYTQLFQELQYCAAQVHKHDGQKLPVPCRVIMDEWYNVCQIPQFINILSYARSFGIGITIICQSLEQPKSLYDKEWGIIVDNCSSLLYLGSINHEDTLKYMSNLIGSGTFDKRTTGRTRGRSGSSSENFDVLGRELMKPDEIRNMDKSECILVLGGRPAFYDKKYVYEKHENYMYTSDANPKYAYVYNPLPAPAVVPKNEKIVEPTKENLFNFESIKFDANQSLASAVGDMAEIAKDEGMSFVSTGFDGEEDIDELPEEVQDEIISEVEQILFEDDYHKSKFTVELNELSDLIEENVPDDEELSRLIEEN